MPTFLRMAKAFAQKTFPHSINSLYVYSLVLFLGSRHFSVSECPFNSQLSKPTIPLQNLKDIIFLLIYCVQLLFFIINLEKNTRGKEN